VVVCIAVLLNELLLLLHKQRLWRVTIVLSLENVVFVLILLLVGVIRDCVLTLALLNVSIP
jgi:hypothetical protein